MQAYHHPALHLPAPAVVITPHFVRAATNFDEYEDENQLPIPMPYDEPAPSTTAVPKKKKATKSKSKPKAKEQPSRSPTPTALGESIRQHTIAAVVKPAATAGKVKGMQVDPEGEDGGGSPTKKGSKLVIKNNRDREGRYSKNEKRAIEEDITRKCFVFLICFGGQVADG
jgi:protein-serine/threonine kinase